jgi:hypothetical protein
MVKRLIPIPPAACPSSSPSEFSRSVVRRRLRLSRTDTRASTAPADVRHHRDGDDQLALSATLDEAEAYAAAGTSHEADSLVLERS